MNSELEDQQFVIDDFDDDDDSNASSKITIVDSSDEDVQTLSDSESRRTLIQTKAIDNSFPIASVLVGQFSAIPDGNLEVGNLIFYNLLY